MKFAKWGNSLALRVPADLVAELGISPGEEAQIKRTGKHSFEVTRDPRRQEAIEKLRSMRFELPDDYVFNREELHER
ncbi:MAG: AbrB/MazE/SpoVT family DNA-binding domain-containing protein [Terracidiphilus sp.]